MRVSEMTQGVRGCKDKGKREGTSVRVCKAKDK